MHGVHPVCLAKLLGIRASRKWVILLDRALLAMHKTFMLTVVDFLECVFRSMCVLVRVSGAYSPSLEVEMTCMQDALVKLQDTVAIDRAEAKL